jgi:hypothetical protein
MGRATIEMQQRMERWVKASYRVGGQEPPLLMFIQNLGRMDCELIQMWPRVLSNLDTEDPGSAGSIGSHLFESALWVLGAYEVVRSLDQRIRCDGWLPGSAKAVNDLKHELARVRMPLAKFEAPGRHESDSGSADGAAHHELGVGWVVAEDTWRYRRTLADSVLEVLEGQKRYEERPAEDCSDRALG